MASVGAGNPPPDLIKDVREEMLRLFMANAQIAAERCVEACIQQVWTACLACLSAQAASEQLARPQFQDSDAAPNELTLDAVRAASSHLSNTILPVKDAAEILTTEKAASSQGRCSVTEALNALEADNMNRVVPDVARHGADQVSDAQVSDSFFNQDAPVEDPVASHASMGQVGHVRHKLRRADTTFSNVPDISKADIVSPRNAKEPLAKDFGEISITESLPHADAVGKANTLENSADLDHANLEEEVEAIQRVVASVVEQLRVLDSEVDAAAQLAHVERERRKALPILCESMASSAQFASVEYVSRRYVRRLVRQLTSEQVQAGYVGYVGSSVDDFCGFFAERRRFEEWLDEAMVSAAMLVDERDHLRGMAPAVATNPSREREHSADPLRFSPRGDCTGIRGLGVAIV